MHCLPLQQCEHLFITRLQKTLVVLAHRRKVRVRDQGHDSVSDTGQSFNCVCRSHRRRGNNATRMLSPG